MSRRLWAILAMLPAMAAANPGLAGDGSALGVDAGATALTGSELRTLTVGADLFIGDRVETNASGLVQIRFADTTELVVGPNSALVLEDYLLRADGSAGKLAVNALAGTFRFVTGNAPKDRYEINTPTGTIGVRGTAFDFNVEGGETSVLLFHGAATLCSRSAACVTLDDTCEVGQYDIRESEIVGLTRKVNAETREALRAAFRYANSQKPLLREFRVRSAENCLKQTVAEELREARPVVVPVEPDPCAEPGSCAPPPPPDDPPPPPPPPDDPPPPPDDPPPPPDDDDEHEDHHDNGQHYEGDHHDNGHGNDGGHGNGNGHGDGHGNGKGRH